MLLPAVLPVAVSFAPKICAAQAASGHDPPAVVDASDAAWAIVAIAASVGVMAVDSRVAQSMARGDVQANGVYRNLAAGATVVNEKSLFAGALVTYGVARVARSPRVARTALHAAEAVLISSVIATGVRGALGRSRPFVTNGDDPFDYRPWAGFRELRYRSFPSIHASASFATAAVVSREVGRDSPRAARYIDPLVYGVAALPGLGRMYRGKHWASDVLLGALLGVETGRAVARYHATHPGSSIDRRLVGTVATDTRGRPIIVARYRF